MKKYLEKKKKILDKNGEVMIRVKINPGMPKTQIMNLSVVGEEEFLKINVAAPPERGRANEKLINFLAEEFAVGRMGVGIMSGIGERIKLVKIIKND